MNSPYSPRNLVALIVACNLLLTAWAATAVAFNPPVDQQGPLTVRIDGPATVTQLDTPWDVRVVMENRSDQRVTGSLRLSGIDDWNCEPAEAIPFQVAANSQSAFAFQVTAGGDTYAARYPLHAHAVFDWQGEQLTAHPILILRADVPSPRPKIASQPWLPFEIKTARRLAIWQLPTHRTVLIVFDGPTTTMPVGWTGSAEPSHGAVRLDSRQSLAGDARDAVAIHPPWSKGQVGTAWIEYPLALPEITPIQLQFATAVTPTGTGDGVTFRVRAARLDAPAEQAGVVVFERHSAAKSWEAGAADLSRFAGQRIRLQLESHPGSAKNTNFDQSYWAEPTLIVGNPPAAAPFPPQQLADASALGQLNVGSRQFTVHVQPGTRGLLDADIGFVSPDDSLFFRGFRIGAFGVRLEDQASPATLVEVIRERCEDGCQIRHRFVIGQESFDLVGSVRIVDDSLRSRFQLENCPAPRPWRTPRIDTVAAGVFSQRAERVYAGHGNVMLRPEAFQLSFDGHRLATSHVGFDFDGGLSLVQAVDLPPDALVVDPTSRHYSVQAAGETTFTFIPASNVWEAVEHYRDTNGWQAAGGVQRLAGRFVFDLWGGQYGSSGEDLQRAFRYGLTDSAVVWHNWQRWGYDYRLPEIYPPNPKLGTEEELRAMIDVCRQADVLFALHDNYIDIYPDAQGFSYKENVAFTASGQPVKAWLNEGRDAQSYRYRADRVEPFLRENLREIHKQLSPTAYFIDVWSSIKPYDYWTSEGQCFDRRYTRDSWREHFAWIRELQGNEAPQISESGHDQLIGWLDGAQTNHLRVGKPVPGTYSWGVWNIECEDAERIPWFDFAHHDRFILHGAGYSGRYQAGLDARTHGIYSDDYLATELLTGHPAMVSRPFGRDVVRKYWLTQPVMRALAMRTIQSVEFVDGDLHRQHVQWSGGGDVWVNRGESDWQIADYCLPQYGFLARIPTENGPLTAAICRRQGLVVEHCESPGSLYVNGRRLAGGAKRIRPEVASMEARAAGRLELAIDWQIDEPIPEGYRPFVHFVTADGEIAFQATCDANQAGRLETGQVRLPATAHLPESLTAGAEFELRVGLYLPGRSAPRLAIMGLDDGERRIRLGTLKLADDAEGASGIVWEPIPETPDPYLARHNPHGTPVDFGGVVTASGCRLTRDGQDLILTPLPEEPNTGTTWDLQWDQLPWQLPRPSHMLATDDEGNMLVTEKLGQRVAVQHVPNAFSYRFCRQ